MMSNLEANRIIAEWIGESGFEPDEAEATYRESGKGHISLDVMVSRKPKNFCSSIDLTVDAIKGKLTCTFDMSERGVCRAFVTRGDLFCRTDFFEHRGEWDGDYDLVEPVERPTLSEALAHAVAETILAMQKSDR